MNAVSAFATEELPFTNYYGQYEISRCKKIDSKNYSTDWCLTKEVLIEKAPACKGAPHTIIFFAIAGQKFNSTCTSVANVSDPISEPFSNGDQLNSENYKYRQEEDGSDHYFIRVTANSRSYIFTDFWLKRNSDQTVTSKFKRRETPLDETSKTISSFEYEMTMKAIK